MIKARVEIVADHGGTQKAYTPLQICIGAKKEEDTTSGLLWTYGAHVEHDLIKNGYKHVATVTLQRVDE